MTFQKISTDLIPKKTDERIGNLLSSNLDQASHILLGYPDDEGVKNNGGRMGAKEGPDGIRKFFYLSTPPENQNTIYDCGNLDIKAYKDIEERHKVAKESLKDIYKKEKKVISLGGGHDYGYPDSSAFCEAFKDEDTIVINFDAHLDVREAEKPLSSGTPFYRLLNEHPEIDFIEIGLLEVCNSKEHIQWLKDKGKEALFYDSFAYENKTLLQKFSENFGSKLIGSKKAFISIDIDVFSSAYSPGCSQSWPFALSPQDFFPLFQLMLARWDVRGLGIYEVSPPLDENYKSQRLAAQILHKFLSS